MSVRPQASRSWILRALLALGLVSCAGRLSQPTAPVALKPISGWVIFASWPGDAGGPVYKARLDGTGVRSLNLIATYLKWDPSGGRFAARLAWTGGPSPNVAIMDSSGRQLHTFVQEGLSFDWRPEGPRLLSGNSVVDISKPLFPVPVRYYPPFHPQSFEGDSVVGGDMLEWAGDTAHIFVRGYGPYVPGDDFLYDFYIINAETGRIESRLTHSHYILPGTSPDSSMGPFYRLSPDHRMLLGGRSRHFVEVLDVATQMTRRVTTQFDDCCGHWAPDNRTIYFLRRDPASGERGYITRWLLYRTSLDSLGVEHKVMDKEIYDSYYDIHFE